MRTRLLAGFGIGNLIVLLLFIAMFRYANYQFRVAPVPVYGDWKTIEGPAFSGSINPNGGMTRGPTHSLANWTFAAYEWSATGTFKPSGDYTNLTFEYSTLNLIANNSKPTIIALGTYSYGAYAYISNGTEYYANYQVKPYRVIANTTFLDTSLTQDYALFADPENTIQHLSGSLPHVESSDSNAHWNLGSASYPCVMWQDKSVDVLRFSLTLPNGTVLYYYPPFGSITIPSNGIFWWNDYPVVVRTFALQYNASVIFEHYKQQEAFVQLNWTYTEFWKYMPIDHYDNSTAITGDHLLSELPVAGLAVVLCDVILMCILCFSDSEKDKPKPFAEPLDEPIHEEASKHA